MWTILLGSLHSLNRLIAPGERARLEAFTRNLIAPAVADLGWAPREGEDELTGQLRGDLIRALGNDPTVQAAAAERYALHLADPATVDPNVLPALIAIRAVSPGDGCAADRPPWASPRHQAASDKGLTAYPIDST